MGARLITTAAQLRKLGIKVKANGVAPSGSGPSFQSIKTRGDISKGKQAAEGIKAYCERAGWPVPVSEHYFHPTRMWRFDLAWPERMLGLEIQGGGFVGGAHGSGGGLASDCEKLSTAAVMGWRVILATHKQIKGKLYGWLAEEFGRNRLRPSPADGKGEKKR